MNALRVVVTDVVAEKGLPEPRMLRRKLRKFEASHVDQVIFLHQAGKNRHEDICSSLELFAREVMPEFHERHGEHERWKQAVLGGDLSLEEIDTEPYNPSVVRTPVGTLRMR